MITIILNNINNLNTSLQVGDLIYRTGTTTNVASTTGNITSDDLTSLDSNVGGGATATNIVGILRTITITGNTVTLDVDESLFFNAVVPAQGQFLMFSKYNQTAGDIIGYYAQAKFKNDSKEKAELFSVGSEVIINSK